MVAKRLAIQACRTAVLIVWVTALCTVANAGPLESQPMKVGSGLTVTLKEGQAIICYVASTVVDIQPNGVIVLEAHQSIIENNDLYAYKLTGKVDPNKVSTDGSVLSENIAELSISKHVFDIRKLIGSL